MNLFKNGFALVLLLLTLPLLGELATAEASERTWVHGAALIASGLLGMALGDSAYLAALSRIGAHRALMVWSLTPAITSVLASPFLGEWLTPLQVLGVGGTLAGVVWVARSQEDGVKVETQLMAGLALASVATLCQAGSNVLVKVGSTGLSDASIATVRLAASVPVLAVQAAWLRQLPALRTALSIRRVAVLLVLACVFGTYFGLWLQVYSLTHAPVGVASTLSTTSPLFVLGLAWLLDKEVPSAQSVGGGLLAVGGVALLFWGAAA